MKSKEEIEKIISSLKVRLNNLVDVESKKDPKSLRHDLIGPAPIAWFVQIGLKEQIKLLESLL